MIEIILPWPPSVNTYYRTFRGRMIISKAGREYRKKVIEECQKTALMQFTGPIAVEIEAHRPDKRKRDIDNLGKASLDALTHAGLWVDDAQIVDLRMFWSQRTGGFLTVKVRAL